MSKDRDKVALIVLVQGMFEQFKRQNELLADIAKSVKRSKLSEIAAIAAAVVTVLGVFQVVDTIIDWISGG